MGRLKMSFFVLAVMVMAIVLSGCASNSPDTRKPLVVATVGAPTPVPTEPPEPTPGPTWVPTPTPVPDPVSLTKINLTGKINGDQRPISGDPNDSLQLNARYATRQDMATFTIKNTGDAPLVDLSIIYELDVPMTTVDSLGHSSTTIVPKNTTVSVGTLKPGDTRDLVIVSPVYEAMQEVNVTIIAKWDGGTFQLYKTRLEPNLSGGISQADIQAVMMYGSANN